MGKVFGKASDLMSCDRTRLGEEIEDSKIQFKCEASCIPKSHYH